MTSTKQPEDSLTNNQRSNVTLQTSAGIVSKEVRAVPVTNFNVQVKPGVYIALEGGRLVPVQPGSLISPSNSATTSKGLPIKISQTLTFSPSCVKKALLAHKVPSIQRGNICPKGTVQVSKSPTFKSAKQPTNKTALGPQQELGGEVEMTGISVGPTITKHKAENEINQLKKKIKTDEGSTNPPRNYFDKPSNVFQDCKLDQYCQKDVSYENSLGISEDNGGIAQEYIYDTLEDSDVEKGDHDYSQLGGVENRRDPFETQEEYLNEEEINNDQNALENCSEEEIVDDQKLCSSSKVGLNKEYEEGMVKNQTIQNSIIEEFIEEHEEEVVEYQTIESSSEEGQIEEYEESIIEDPTIQNSLSSNEEHEEEVDQKESLPQQKYSCPTKRHGPLKTSQSNNYGETHANTPRRPALLQCTSKSVYIGGLPERKVCDGSTQNRRPRVNDKFPELPVPATINQYGDCLKTRLGRYHYGLTLNDTPCQFFQGVLKGASGQTLAAMFGDVNLFAKFEGVSLDEIGHFMIDTTFKVIPDSTEGVNQVLTISLLHQNVVIPLWYAITSCSSPELYKRILIEFQQHVMDWPFISVLVNNDPALCKALRAVFPDVDIYGSWYHYCFSVWKEVSLQNLTEQCKAENSTLLKAVKLLMVLAFLPPSTVNTLSVTMLDGFEYVRDFARENNLPKEFDRVLDYVAAFWFNKVRPENFTVFGKHTWALNHIEVLQLLLISYMKQNGNVWVLTRAFQSIARSTYTEFIRFLNGKRLIVKKKRGKRFNVPIRINIKKLMAGSIDVKTYLEKSTLYLVEMLDIFLHPLYPTTTYDKTNYIHTKGWAVRIRSD